VDRYFETVKLFGVVNDGKGLEYFITKKDAEAVSRIPIEFEPGYIAFVIGAKHNTKQLPAEKIASIISKLRQPVVMLGGAEDYAKGEKVAILVEEYHQSANANDSLTISNPVYNACGKFTLNESAALLKYASFVITHDTGLMHIAAAYHKKIVSVWGNTIPEFGMYPYMPEQTTKSLIAEVKGLSCRPCSKIGYEKCPRGHFKCMRDIDTAEIVRFLHQ
jgi:ADP-heptose:LPS heptosyltransferase